MERPPLPAPPVRPASFRQRCHRATRAGGSVVLAAGLLVAAVGAASRAQGATFVVDSTADTNDAAPGDGVCADATGACTLRAAVRETNALAGADVIELPAGTYVLTISGQQEESAATGDLDLRGDLTIVGAGSAVTVVDGNALDRVFECPQTGAPHTIAISGLTVQNGNSFDYGVPYGFGGGIAVSSGSSNVAVTLTLDDVILDGNVGDIRGCGLWINGTNHAVITSSVIRNHVCPDVSGSGIEINGTVEIVDTLFQNNVGGTGGGLRTFGSLAGGEIRGCSFLNNTARDGGAIYNAQSLTVYNTLFDGNHGMQVGYSGGYGGAIDNTRNMWIYDSVFSGNIADSMGAAVTAGGSSGNVMEMTRCLFEGNTAAYFAAGAYIGSGTYLLSDCTFSGNVCGTDPWGEGCAVYTAAVPTVTIKGCTFAGNVNNFGGSTALEVYNGTVTVDHTIFAGGTGGPSCGGTVVSAGYNIDSGTSCGLGSTGDQPSTDPLLGPLADNGGPSWTHAPLAGSPAIDGGDPSGACTATDQRGAPRPADGNLDELAECDVGAVEVMLLADLAIAKDDGATSAVPGSSTVYEITVSNAGPDDTTGAVVTDPFDDPAFDLSQVVWTCAPDAGAGSGTTCPVSGTGDDLAAGVTVDLEASDSVTFTATAPLLPGATGTLSNTATVAPGSAGDLSPDNDTSTDSEPLTPEADLWVTADDGLDFVHPGHSLTYSVEVGNSGPSDEPGAAVSDAFPADLDCTWTCVPAGGASCPADPVSGDIDATVVLPAGDSATFTAECTVAASATGSLENTASIAPSAGVSDTEPTNDSATDTTEVRPLDFGDAPDPTYPTLLASNGACHGIVPALHLGSGADAELDGQPGAGADGDDSDGTDDEDGVALPASLVAGFDAAVDVTASAAGLLNAWVDFNADGDWDDPGEQVFTDEPLAAGVNNLVAPVPLAVTAAATYARFRLDSAGGLAPSGPAADGEVEDYAVTLAGSPELSVSLADASDPAEAGGPLGYLATVTNDGTAAATGVTLVTTLPPDVTFVSATPGAPTCTEAGGEVTCDLGTLASGASTQVEIATNVNLGVTGTITCVAEVTLDQADPVPADNVDSEGTRVFLDLTIFRDDFETGDTSAWQQ